MKIFHAIFYAAVWLFSKIPFWVIYLISDFFYVIIYYLVGYRKKIVLNNLRNSFPKKSEKEIKRIAKDYYHNLCDIMLETFKKRSLKEKDYHERITIKNFDIVDQLYKDNKSLIAAVGHCGNFEWIMSYMSLVSPHDTYVTVKPLASKFFDEYVQGARAIFGLKPYNHKLTYEVMEENKDKATMTIIGGDQTPMKHRANYWINFLNQDTSFYLGIEKIAKLFNLAVVFFDIYKTQRGHYTIEAKLVTDNPSETKEHEIIEGYIRKLEESINIHPADWLWSHRRWKHKKPENLD